MQNKLEQLYREQIETFELARKNYQNLKNVVYRTITFDGFDIKIQFNSDRILSTNAKIDSATLQARKCFLCPENMPAEQKGVPYGDKYHIFVNPYPIFDRHFTVPANDHAPQLIDGRFDDMLNLSADLEGYTLFYNGPQCGASAPDHFHFQIAPRNIMPIEKDVENPNIISIREQKEHYTIATMDHYLRKALIIKSTDKNQVYKLFHRIRRAIGELIPYEQEPRFNLLAWFADHQWTVCIMPRKLLRPWQFFAEGADKILFSPGCVDMAGLVISPRKEDFEHYDKPLLTDLFSQVTLTDESWEILINSLKLNPLIHAH